ncbi:D-aminoacyl-tRNA deacylase [Halorussus amylolyticus]|uniref:D-aminoacyl-tRNA deacylase n=1 Tax=Halorussus amylolyticus TaxID=1126242 RepID=UPI00104E1AFB|nr:D-aminoacyl-tRNA deacylase [Halorussus amylolyticus]
MIAIVVSRADSASVHIGDHLLDLADWETREDESRPDAEGGATYYRREGFELREFDALHLEIEETAEPFDSPDLLVFVSRHSGNTGPLLTAHFTGNFGPAEFGGTDGGLAETCPNAHDRLLDAFAEHAPEGYEVGTECTHHGPSEVGVPSLFAELGSDEAQWDDPEGARAVARAVLDLEGVEPHRERQIAGFGGGHYAPRFTRILSETDWAVGHVAADWCLDAMGAPEENRDVIRRAFEASRAERAVVDGDRPELESVIEDLGYRVVSETWVRETTGRPLELVERLEADLSPVGEGLRFGERAADTETDGDYELVSLPGDLLAEAQGIDPETTREAVEARAVAFETEQSGTRTAGRVAVSDSEDREALVESLVDVLAEKYDSVAREDGAVVARETTFDAEKARKLGVREGPAFGKLSAGESVAVDGEEIPPEAVRSERVRRFSE